MRSGWISLSVEILRAGIWCCFLAISARPLAADLFAERARELGLDFVHFNGMSGELYYSEMVGSGLAWVDYDLDGDLDMYLVQGHMLGAQKSLDDAVFSPAHPLPLSDRLYRNDLSVDADGEPLLRFVDVTQASGIATIALEYGMGVTVGDVDNDGDPDLYLTNAGANQLLRNNGDGTFSDITEQTGTGDRGWGVSAAFADYDRDGYLDLYVGNYVDYRLATDKQCIGETGGRDYCGPLAYQPQPDRLYHNRGDDAFEDATVAAALDRDEGGGALGVVAADLNEDGWVDFYVTNDQRPNTLWVNQQDGTFLSDAELAGCAVNEEGQPEASMGVVVGDLDGDIDDDLFMSHLTRESNTLYLNQGNGLFVDASRESGLGNPSWGYTGFGLALFDYDLDGWLDIAVANGAVRLIEEQLRLGDPYALHQRNQLYRNTGRGIYEDVSSQAGAMFELSEVSRGVAVGDIDNDGDPDFAISNNAGPVRLAENLLPHTRSWLGVDLRSAESGGGAVSGGRGIVWVEPSQMVLSRRFATDGSYASAQDPRMLFGLGVGGRVARLQIRWPDGRRSEWAAVPTDRYLVIRKPLEVAQR